MATILIAEDDPSIRAALERALKQQKYQVVSAKDGAEALEMIVKHTPELILLDIMMPHMSGLAICKHLREQGDSTPILIITARHEISERVEGLDAGADDYLPKPFSRDELLARVRALLRRTSVIATQSEGESDTPPAAMQIADLFVDPASRQAKRGERALSLTKTEFDILELLVHNRGRVVPREEIYERIWGYDLSASSKSLDVHIGYLRRKMEADGLPRLLENIHGVGYIIKEPDGQAPGDQVPDDKEPDDKASGDD